MYFSKVATNALILSLPLSSNAFTFFSQKPQASRTAFVKLSQQENEDYLFGGEVEGMPDKPPKAPPVDEENPMGGEMFRKMMEKAKNRSSDPRSIPQSQRSPENEPPSSPGAPPPPQPQMQTQPATPAATPMDPQTYYQMQLQAWQQQMTAFAQFSAANPEAAASMTMPPPPPPPTTFGQQPPPPPQAAEPEPQQFQSEEKSDGPKDIRDYLPKGIKGRNRDSYEVTNTADLYFAQLKRDSAVRHKARQAGDIEFANKPFEEEGVKALAGYLNEDLLAQRREQNKANGGEFMTSEDEMLIPYDDSDVELDVTSAGISYKDKLAEMKRKRAGGGTAAPAAAVAPVGTATPPPPPPQPQAPPVEVKPFTMSPVTIPDTPAVSAAAVEQQTAENQQPNFALPTKSEDSIAEISAPSMEDSEENRRSIRTLMGLILKHRGGPGFGAGRLRANEADRLKSTLGDVLAVLKDEAGMDSSTVVEEPVAAVATPPAPIPTSAASSVSNPQLAGAITCVEGALAMYKQSSESDQEGLMLPVRDALLSAANTINKVIAENEVENVKQYEEAAAQTSAPPVTPDPSPVQEEVVVKEEEAPAPVIVNRAKAKASNTEKFQDIYDLMQNIQGDGKFGLKDLTAEEISLASDALIDMRTILMEELDLGIPEEGSSSNEESVEEEASGSKYQQMLLKAKAEKLSKSLSA